MKTHSFVAVLFFTISAAAQKHSLSFNLKPSFTYLGKQTQRFHHPYFVSRKGDATFNSSLTILYAYSVNAKLGFSTGLEFSQQGQNINFNADSVFPSNNRKILEVKLNYIRIPLLINYSVLKKAKSSLNVYSGISYGMAVKRKDNYQNIILEKVLLAPAKDRYKATDWAIPVGVSFKKNLTAKTFVLLGFEYLFGLTNTFTDYGKYGVLSEFDNARQSRLALNIGLGLSLKK